jgi:hypothetical protein
MVTQVLIKVPVVALDVVLEAAAVMTRCRASIDHPLSPLRPTLGKSRTCHALFG